MTLIVRDMQGNAQGELELPFALSAGGKGSQAVHDAVVAHRAKQRSGTACTKTMGEVAGSGKKPWRQKGTGRARAGSFASPLWRGGGVVFGPKPRDFSKKVSKATRSLAFHKAISDRVRGGDVLVVTELKLGAAKTKEMVGFLKTHNLGMSTLIVAAAVDPKLVLAARNLPKVEVTTVGFLNTYQVLRHDKLVFSREALELLSQRLKTQ